VVMESGRIRQTGTPREIYRHPQSQFVAQFIGDINLVPGIAGQATVEALGARVATPVALPAGRHCTIGFRPEDVVLAGTTTRDGALTFEARVTELTWTGATGRLHAMAGEQPVSLVLLAAELEAQAPQPGETLTLAVPAERIHVFPKD